MEWNSLGLLSFLILWMVVIIQFVLTLALARMVGRLTRQIHPSGARVIDPGPEIDQTVENWEGLDLFDQPVQMQFPRQRGVFLLFISPHCSLCAALMPSAKRFFKEISGEAEGIWVMVLGSREAQISYAQQNGLNQTLVLAEDQIPSSWRVGGTPFGLWVDAQGVVKTKGMVNDRDHLESLRNAVRMGHPSLESFVSAEVEKMEIEREGVLNPN